MNWESMRRHLPQIAEVTKVFGDTLADAVEKRHPKLAPLARGGLKAIETFADEAGGATTASFPATTNQYPQPQMPWVPPQQDPVLEKLLTEQHYRERLSVGGAPNSSSSMYGEGGGDLER